VSVGGHAGYPAAGPYDLRLGYASLPSFEERLTARGFTVTAQACGSMRRHSESKTRPYRVVGALEGSTLQRTYPEGKKEFQRKIGKVKVRQIIQNIAKISNTASFNAGQLVLVNGREAISGSTTTRSRAAAKPVRRAPSNLLRLEGRRLRGDLIGCC
jgi:hypothetical protein